MVGDTQLVMERPVRSRTPNSTTLKTILLHVEDGNAFEECLEAALSLARASSAHVTCLHVTPIEAYVAFDSLGGIFVMSDIIDALDKSERRMRVRVEEKLRHEDVSWDYVQITGNVVGQILRHASLADLVVTGRDTNRGKSGDFNQPMLGDLLQASRTPLFVPADGANSWNPTGSALIAWDGSYEAANAVRASLGMLKLASEVRVLRVDSGKPEDFPGTGLLEYLSRHDIHAEITVESGGHDDDYVAACLIRHAQAPGAYIVMGGYSHSRVREFFFGGVTRTLLSASNVPLVIAH
jgi:nucleotide-binding universal stress UspA family protein